MLGDLLDFLRSRRRDRRRVRRRRRRALADAELVRAYLAGHPVAKLQLGASGNDLPGWLNSDLAPPSHEYVRLDASEPFPLPDGAFDYVFSEQMIEHLGWEAGRQMLAECRRVLKPGGTLRIATPDLARIISLYGPDRSPECEVYLDRFVRRFLPDATAADAVARALNLLFHGWGHQFLYDAPALRGALLEAGFARVVACRPGESADPNLRGIERHGHIVGEELNDFETMVFEATHP